MWKKGPGKRRQFMVSLLFVATENIFIDYTITSGLTLLIITIFFHSMNSFASIFFCSLIFLHFCHWSWWFFYSTFLSLFVYDFRCLLDVVHAVWWFQWKPFYINDSRIHTNKRKKMWLITSFVRSFSCLLSRCYGKSQHLVFIKSLHTNC